MSHDLLLYGSTEPLQFKATLNGAGVTGLTFQAADIQLSVDGTTTWASIGTQCNNEIGNGIYQWEPTSSTQTQAQQVTISIIDSSGSEFDENALIMVTGGSSLARFSG